MTTRSLLLCQSRSAHPRRRQQDGTHSQSHARRGGRSAQTDTEAKYQVKVVRVMLRLDTPQQPVVAAPRHSSNPLLFFFRCKGDLTSGGWECPVSPRSAQQTSWRVRRERRLLIAVHTSVDQPSARRDFPLQRLLFSLPCFTSWGLMSGSGNSGSGGNRRERASNSSISKLSAMCGSPRIYGWHLVGLSVPTRSRS